jgi:hypothetical protein
MVLNSVCDIWVAEYKLLVPAGRIRTERQATDVVCGCSLTFDTRLSVIQRYRKLERNARKIFVIIVWNPFIKLDLKF